MMTPLLLPLALSIVRRNPQTKTVLEFLEVVTFVTDEPLRSDLEFSEFLNPILSVVPHSTIGFV
jgi:hypothetical protein